MLTSVGERDRASEDGDKFKRTKWKRPFLEAPDIGSNSRSVTDPCALKDTKFSHASVFLINKRGW